MTIAMKILISLSELYYASEMRADGGKRLYLPFDVTDHNDRDLIKLDDLRVIGWDVR